MMNNFGAHTLTLFFPLSGPWTCSVVYFLLCGIEGFACIFHLQWVQRTCVTQMDPVLITHQFCYLFILSSPL